MLHTRLVCAADTPLLATLHAAAFGPQAWTEIMLTESLANQDVWGLVIEHSAQPVGFALCQQVDADSEILTFVIVPEQQGRGLGRHLMQALYDHAKACFSHQIYLEVAEDNRAARQLYAHFGFVQIGRRHGYYPRPHGAVAAILMNLKIKSV